MLFLKLSYFSFIDINTYYIITSFGKACTGNQPDITSTDNRDFYELYLLFNRTVTLMAPNYELSPAKIPK